jgi:hypothetical protein
MRVDYSMFEGFQARQRPHCAFARRGRHGPRRAFGKPGRGQFLSVRARRSLEVNQPDASLYNADLAPILSQPDVAAHAPADHRARNGACGRCLAPVLSRMVFSGFVCVMLRSYVMAMGQMSVMAGLLMFTRFGVLRGRQMMFRSLLMVLCCLTMMFGAFLRHKCPHFGRFNLPALQSLEHSRATLHSIYNRIAIKSQSWSVPVRHSDRSRISPSLPALGRDAARPDRAKTRCILFKASAYCGCQGFSPSPMCSRTL